MDAEYTTCVLSAFMTPEESAKLIEKAGGIDSFAELIGITDHAHYQQRVNNWRSRGIPPKVVLEHLAVIQRLQESPTETAA